MLNENAINAASAAPTSNVGLTAFQVAVVQAKVFKKTLEEVSERQELEARAAERKADEQRQRLRERLAKQRGGVDVVVDGSDSGKSANALQDAGSGSQGREVDIEV